MNPAAFDMKAPIGAYNVSVDIAGKNVNQLYIRNYNEIATIVKMAFDNINQFHTYLEISCLDYPNKRELEERLGHYRSYSKAHGFALSFFPIDRNKIVVQPSPLEIQEMGQGKIRSRFADGFVEEFTDKDYYHSGTRVFPDGTKEQGLFYKRTGALNSGYRIDPKGKIEFVDPKFLAYFLENEQDKLLVIEFEGKLAILRKKVDKKIDRYEMTEYSVLNILAKVCQREARPSDQSIKKILEHKDFDKHLKSFIDYSLEADANGTPRLFGFSDAAALDTLEAATKDRKINPLKIVDPHSGRHLFLHAVYREADALLSFLVENFSESFRQIGLDVIDERLRQGRSANHFGKEYVQLGGSLDTFHRLWLQVSNKYTPLDDTFRKDFETLSDGQKRIIYDAAFNFDNPFLQEPPDIPVKAGQYSVNLMWINQYKMLPDQEFLFEKGNAPEERQLNFQKEFVDPISQWALANPGTQINIWIDSEMATKGSIERTRLALQEKLKDSPHGTIVFRDVREIMLSILMRLLSMKISRFIFAWIFCELSLLIIL